MKNLKFVLIFLIVLPLTSCFKNNPNIKELVFNEDWVLVESYYLSPVENGYQKHPNNSIVNPSSGIDTPMDVIIKDSSVWRFNESMFMLNGDVLLTNSNVEPRVRWGDDNTLMLFFGNTTRIMTLNKKRLTKDGVLEFEGIEVGSFYKNDRNVLIFTKDGSYSDITENKLNGLNKIDTLIQSLIGNGFNRSEMLHNTEWFVDNISIINGFPQPNTQQFNISFNPDGSYTVNGNGNGSMIYKLVGIPGQPMYDLELYSFTPVGGESISIRVSLNSVTNGLISNSKFNSLFNRSSHGFISMSQQ